MAGSVWGAFFMTDTMCCNESYFRVHVRLSRRERPSGCVTRVLQVLTSPLMMPSTDLDM
jgi:hypothetical protein